MNLLVFEKNELQTANNTLVLRDGRAQHLRSVLRVELGESVRLGQINGGIGRGVVAAVNDTEVVLVVSELAAAPARPNIDLVLALPRPQSLKKVLQTVATMGVGELVLIASARVEKNYFSSPLLRDENLNSYLRLGLEQGANTWQPRVSIFKNFSEFLEEKLPALTQSWSRGYVLHPNAPQTLAEAYGLATGAYSRTNSLEQLAKRLADEVLSERIPESSSLQDVAELQTMFDSQIVQGQSSPLGPKKHGVVIGPEGGWLPKELDAFQAKNLQIVQISKRILRVETAVCAALSQFELLEQLQSMQETNSKGFQLKNVNREGSHVEREEQSNSAAAC